jgi:competence protein ComGC
MNKKGITLVEIAVGILIVSVILLYLGGYSGCEQFKSTVREKGLKGVLTEVWEGPSK